MAGGGERHDGVGHQQRSSQVLGPLRHRSVPFARGAGFPAWLIGAPACGEVSVGHVSGSSMRVFISWSGAGGHDGSRKVAEALGEYLEAVVQGCGPWVSSSDMKPGDRWSAVIGEQLNETDFGIICLTRHCLAAPWILFEAGALSKSITTGVVVPYLIGLDAAALTGRWHSSKRRERSSPTRSNSSRKFAGGCRSRRAQRRPVLKSFGEWAKRSGRSLKWSSNTRPSGQKWDRAMAPYRQRRQVNRRQCPRRS